MNMNHEKIKKLLLQNSFNEEKKNVPLLKLKSPIQRLLKKRSYKRVLNILSKFNQFDELSIKQSCDMAQKGKKENQTQMQIHQTIFTSSSMNLESSEDVLIKMPTSLIKKQTFFKW